MTQRLIAIIRTSSPALAVTASRALFAAGLGLVEVALTTPGALDAIGVLAGERPEGCWVGAGTVLDVAMASDSGGGRRRVPGRPEPEPGSYLARARRRPGSNSWGPHSH